MKSSRGSAKKFDEFFCGVGVYGDNGVANGDNCGLFLHDPTVTSKDERLGVVQS